MTEQVRPDRAPMDEEEIQRVQVGGAHPQGGDVVLCAYDARWPVRYATWARELRAALGGTARRLEHVGSTSVPGLDAKPVVDMLLEVPDPADEDAYVPAATALGFRLSIREPDWYEHRVLKRFEPEHTANLHVFPESCPETERMVRFRDRLRADDADRELYARTKYELAAREWTYLQQYADAKSAVVDEILHRAGHR
ncbi:GrpB family protein [Streptomyces sp. 549]|uniref:GrpB family protein n=1 Tax=Streptomyces sp. 549 TaxID=3049076 RepID=UPI0024C39174|nr:GrpB family protein [Streptomyces sp. 549]MDK1471983.1 GrpB family protein [Streptomyces sp. 549]